MALALILIGILIAVLVHWLLGALMIAAGFVLLVGGHR